MTFSIVGLDAGSGDLGVAVASKFPSVGAVVPWAKAGVGAVATQAAANPTFGPRGLDLLAARMDAAAVLDALVAADEGRDERQAGIVDAHGGVATFTGTDCFDWAGGLTGDGFACQGNILAGEAVVEGMAEAFAGAEGDLAVDDHPDAPAELVRLFGVWDDTMLVRHDVATPVTPPLAEELQRRLASLGYFTGEPTGGYDAATRQALADWAGWENLEMRLREDDRVSEHLVVALRAATTTIS